MADNNNAQSVNRALCQIDLNPEITIKGLRSQPILSLIAISTLSILSNGREMDRVKTCPALIAVGSLWAKQK